MDDPKTPSTVTNPKAQPTFKGDKKRLIALIDGRLMDGRPVDYPDELIPSCFGDPNLESGICNPLLPLRDGEPHLCAVHKSCLVAKMLSRGVAVDFMRVREKPYEEVLAEADQLFDQPPEEPEADQSDETRDRHVVRASAISVGLQPPPNPYRRSSLRRWVLDILAQDWISLKDLKAALRAKKDGIRRIDLVIGQVTSMGSQESHGYRIIESMGRYKAFRR